MISLPRLRAVTKSNSDLEFLRDAVVGQWEKATGGLWLRRIGYVQEMTVPDRTNKVWLSLRPLETLTSVEEREKGSATWTTVDSSGYYNDEHRVERIGQDYFEKNVRFTYTGGYADDTAPEDILNAIATQVQFLQQRLSNEHLISRSRTVGDSQVVFLESAGQHPYFKQIAQQRRRKV